jgi:hypothetical protein
MLVIIRKPLAGNTIGSFNSLEAQALMMSTRKDDSYICINIMRLGQISFMLKVLQITYIKSLVVPNLSLL